MKAQRLWMAACLSLSMGFSSVSGAGETCPPLLNYSARTIDGKDVLDFCKNYRNQVVLVVNTASQCGYTPQLKGLETLYQKYKDRGLVIVGFPSNDFHQEFAEEEITAKVCYLNYGVSFPMLSTSSVKGSSANALFKRLIAQTGQEPQWNFYKYLVSQDGKTVSVYPSETTPEQLEPIVQGVLK